jgi:hypothetical protein
MDLRMVGPYMIGSIFHLNVRSRQTTKVVTLRTESTFRTRCLEGLNKEMKVRVTSVTVLEEINEK